MYGSGVREKREEIQLLTVQHFFLINKYFKDLDILRKICRYFGHLKKSPEVQTLFNLLWNLALFNDKTILNVW